MKRRWVVLGSLALLAIAQPLQAQNPKDAWIALLDAGKIEEGREQLVTYAGGLPPVEATKVLRWIEAISMTEAEDQATLASALVLVEREQASDAVELLVTHVGERTDDAAPLLIAVAARTAEAGGDLEQANALRVRLIEDHPTHPATPEAVLNLAEHRLSSGMLLVETAALVEDLIVNQPTHPLVPTARRVLDRLREAPGAHS